MKAYPVFIVIALLLFLGGENNAFGQVQERDLEIAKEYFNAGEFDKAMDMFERLSKRDDNLPYVYNPLLECYLQANKKEEAEKLIKKMIKVSDENLHYKIDHYLLMREWQGVEKSQKELSSLINEVKENEGRTEKTAEFLLKSNLLEETKTLFLASRKSLRNDNLYSIPLSNVYYRLNQVDLSIEELLQLLKSKPETLEQVKNAFQNNLTKEKELDLLENRLYELIQQSPNTIAYSELLLWLNLQKKNFRKAFMQAKAIDKRYKMLGSKLMEVAKIAMDNRDYENASTYFDYVVKEYADGPNYPMARRELIRAKEEAVKASFPVDTLKINSLIGDYLKFINELGNNTATIEARRSVAELYAFYLNDKDTAITILNTAITFARNDLRGRNNIKLTLGDIYLLKGEPWESTLLYSQVEKEMVEDPLGHEAKLKNAKLSFYRGDFELAQGHLDVLKLATSREIANDAMDLSILIQDNIGLDSTEEAMKIYAAIDLLLFQNKTKEALAKTDSMLLAFPGHSLTDELLWLKSKIFLKMKDDDQAMATLEQICTTYSDDILGDNALFTLGILYEENKKDKAKAMEYYQKFMLQYPSSIYTVEARKRFRTLRGDTL